MSRIAANVAGSQQADVSARLTEAVAAHGQGRLGDALALYRQVLDAQPDNVDALNLAGLALVHGGAYAAASPFLVRALVLDPGFAEAINHLALVLLRTGQHGPALKALLRAIAVRPGFVEAHANCGGALFDLGQWRQAIGWFDRTIGLSPAYAEAHANRANALQLLGDLDEARLGYRRSLALRPDLAEALSNLASLDQAEGDLSTAIAGFRHALAVRPTAWVHSNLLFCLSYDNETSKQAFFAEFRRWDATYGRPFYPPSPPEIRDPDPERRLKIGWISADFRDHPVARNVIGLIEQRSRSQGETILYSSVRVPDAMTTRFREAADTWRTVIGWPDADVARQIRADGVDILIVLAGHTGHNRIGVAAHRPAPVQVSFHDLATSGLDVVDAWITDTVLHPPETGERFTERLVHLPCFYLHEPPTDAPEPSPPPSLRSGHVTFGSCNNTSKHTPEVLSLWADVLAATPGSRLLLKYLNRYASARLRRRVESIFADRGVDPSRLIFVQGELGRRDQLALLGRIDIALDPFPFNGSTTTFEALWMGVPVVTMAGDGFLGRVGASVLHQIGLDDMVASDRDAYLDIAVRLAADRPRLVALRRDLRQRLAASLICDVPAHVQAFEQALRTLWRDRCGRK